MVTVPHILNYLLHLGTALVLLGLFMAVYTKATPYREFELIAARNGAAAISFSGALLGFSLTLAAAVLQSSTLPTFVAWAGAAGAVQLLTFLVLSLVFKNLGQHIEQDNRAIGILVGCTSLATGALNAACLI